MHFSIVTDSWDEDVNMGRGGLILPATQHDPSFYKHVLVLSGSSPRLLIVHENRSSGGRCGHGDVEELEGTPGSLEAPVAGRYPWQRLVG